MIVARANVGALYLRRARTRTRLADCHGCLRRIYVLDLTLAPCLKSAVECQLSAGGLLGAMHILAVLKRRLHEARTCWSGHAGTARTKRVERVRHKLERRVRLRLSLEPRAVYT